jgi:L-ascorbate metabolism protein UlaG (beta-lactamase superfamily)
VKIRWYGQSAFLLTGEHSVFIDPFGRLEGLAERGLAFDYPPIVDVAPELLLITHEHADHNATEAIAGNPQIVRSTAGRFETALGPVTAIASEHDAAAGTMRGPNTIFAFELDGLAVCHFGDFGQATLRPEQAEAVGRPDVLILPVGGGPTLDGAQAAAIASSLGARVVVPMHYRTPAISFLEPLDAFIGAFDGRVEHVPDAYAELEPLLADGSGPVALVLAAPLAPDA